MKTRHLGVICLVGAFVPCALVSSVSATSPYTPIIDSNENMEADTDSYTPSDTGGFAFNPLNDPALDGLPPGADATSTGAPYGDAGDDWFDIRNAGVGVIEEVPSGFGGVAPRDGSANFAILQFEAGDGPFGRANRDKFNGPTTGPDPIGAYSAQTDLYLDPALAFGGPDGIPDFWWTNAVNGLSSNNYISESGMAVTILANGDWRIQTTTNNQIVDVPAGSWVTMEVVPFDNGGDLWFDHKVWNSDHTALLGSFSQVAFGNPLYADLAGPRYNWFTLSAANVPYVLIDNVGWTSPIVQVPEPSSLMLLAAGGACAVLVRRRRARSV